MGLRLSENVAFFWFSLSLFLRVWGMLVQKQQGILVRPHRRATSSVTKVRMYTIYMNQWSAFTCSATEVLKLIL